LITPVLLIVDDDRQALAASFEALKLVRFYSKPPGKKADLEVPYVLRRGSTVEDAAAHVHRDFAEHLRYARLFRRPHEHDGVMVEGARYSIDRA
jgi:uncharacterized protein